MLPPGYRLANLAGPKSPELEADLVTFWVAHGALPNREAAAQRVGEVLFVVQDAEFRLAGVSTVYEQHHPELGFPMLHFRCFVAPDHRRHGLAEALLIACTRHLNEAFVASGGVGPRGLYLEVESPVIQHGRPEAVWGPYPFVFVGRNARGHHLRLCYFDGAKIS